MSRLLSITARGSLALALALAQLLAAAAPRAQPAPLQGVVTQVTDGDTLRFTPAGQPPIVVRLASIDAPEICQAWGPEARQALIELALNKPATLRPAGRDSFGRTVGVLMVDGMNVAQSLVEGGHAWSLRWRNDTGPMVKQERMAKALNRGLHVGGGAVKPADFRRTNGPCSGPGAFNPAAPLLVAAARPFPLAPHATAAVAVPVHAAYRCDGRQHCSQMHSCDEARYFLAHCPGVKMDGDHDGIPCEDQWCR
ncbi:MAG: thermonuclease family protein [Rubrivivax sp.]|nr:thermonuclease family protein [Rubrivivax sp.]